MSHLRSETPARRPSSTAMPVATSGFVVLLDPDERSLRALRAALHDEGFRVAATWSVSEARSIASRQRPDAFVVAAPGRTDSAVAVLGSETITKTGCLRVLVGAPAASAHVDLAVDAREAAHLLGPALREAVTARKGGDEPCPSGALRDRARKIVAAVARPGHEDLAHCERVARWSSSLAVALELSPSRVLDVELGALLHDIGELHVRDETLRKASPLTPAELARLKEHPRIGAELLRDVPELHRAIGLVLCHHERPDGTGYPRGLTGAAIPIDARIFTVIDAYEALVIGRPWRPAVDHATAIARMAPHVGSQFDRAVFATFAALPAQTWSVTTPTDAIPRKAA